MSTTTDLKALWKEVFDASPNDAHMAAIDITLLDEFDATKVNIAHEQHLIPWFVENVAIARHEAGPATRALPPRIDVLYNSRPFFITGDPATLPTGFRPSTPDFPRWTARYEVPARFVGEVKMWLKLRQEIWNAMRRSYDGLGSSPPFGPPPEALVKLPIKDLEGAQAPVKFTCLNYLEKMGQKVTMATRPDVFFIDVRTRRRLTFEELTTPISRRRIELIPLYMVKGISFWSEHGIPEVRIAHALIGGFVTSLAVPSISFAAGAASDDIYGTARKVAAEAETAAA